MPRASAADVAAAKETVLAAVAAGKTVKEATAQAGRSPKTFESWRASDKEFARRVDELRSAFKSGGAAVAASSHNTRGRRDLTFAEWRKEFLNFDTYPHMQWMIDAIEGRDPGVPDGCLWDQRTPNRILINIPVFHAKTQTVTVDYVNYMICMNPDIRIAVVSKRQEMARKLLYQIKSRLTSNRFAKLQAAYAPEGGWKPANGEGSFTQNLLYVAGRSADNKDATVEALGIGGQIYGGRFDMIIMDDCVVLSNANEYEKQITWLESEVESRVKNGPIVIVGTRLSAQDLYSELRVDDRYLSGRSPWSYLRMPMVLEFADDPKDWVTLWPTTTTAPDASAVMREDGTYQMWDGEAADRVRNSKPPAVWSLVYQQQSHSADAAFHPVAVLGATDRQRRPGPLKAGALGHPRSGKEGMWTIASMDPAAAGDSFVVVGSVSRVTQERWIENAWVSKGGTQWIREIIKQVTDEYGVNEWVIESNAFQLFLVQDPEIRTFLSSRGVKLTPHYSGRNKQDPDFGVMSLSGLFGTVRRINDGAGREVHNGDNLIRLPDQNYSVGVKALIEQLLTWEPGRRGKDLKMDGPMALWFFDLRARNILGFDRQQEAGQVTHVRNKFLSRRRQKKRGVAPAHLMEGGLYG